MFTKEPPEKVKIIHTVSIPAGRWCSSFQAEIKAIAFALEEVAQDQELKTVRIMSNSRAVFKRIKYFGPSILCNSVEEKDILVSLQLWHRRKFTVTFTWCQSRC